MKVTAQRDGVTKIFPRRSWDLMPKNKWGWVEISEPIVPQFVADHLAAAATAQQPEQVNQEPQKRGRKSKK